MMCYGNHPKTGCLRGKWPMPDEQIKKAVEAAPDALEDRAVREAMLAELAALPLIEYEQRRKEAKKRLGVRYSVLDAEVAKRRPTAKSSTDTPALFADTELWPEAVDGAALLGALSTEPSRVQTPICYATT